MTDVFTRKWFIATIATWFVVFAFDELVYYWWKQIHPGSQYSGLFVKHPTTSQAGNNVAGYPNGFRPGGGVNAAG